MIYRGFPQVFIFMPLKTLDFADPTTTSLRIEGNINRNRSNRRKTPMGSLMAMLAFGTLGFFAVLAFLASRTTLRLKDDPNHKPSSLCANSSAWAETRQ
ncbi:hypothetical protein [Cognatiyoonia sp. IB215182]|uniref:hypothetical protein n=1 Tax=Cognatiyoonia sp. IB215182 TaxID=3097353 RepID=UPI002A101FC6|nr:hypothetical protein [Cognatiyoonia sp. IB215182]MDX8353813.1 hypothetical protein [Cognatiyoonia sp. IB215182]